MLNSSRTSGSASLAWWAVLLLALIGTAAALLHKPDSGVNPFLRLSRELLTASWVTGTLCAAAGTIATTIGVCAAMMRVSRVGALQFFAASYVEIFRGIPVIVLMLLVYYGINPLLDPAKTGLEMDLRLGRFWAAVAALSVCYGAFICEAVRAGIEAIPVEEIEAASLEGTRLQVFFHVILPQAFRIVMPAWTNEMIAMLKDTSLVYVVALTEITYAARTFGLSTGRVFEAYTAVAVVYLVLTLVLSRISRWMERRWHAEMFLSGS